MYLAAMLNVTTSSVRRVSSMSKAFSNISAWKCYKYRNFSFSCPSTKSFVVKDNDEFMQKVMNSNNPVIVNFHAEWCDPCKILSPKLKELVDPLDDIDLAVVDVEKNVELVHTFEVKAVPAVLAIRNGLVVDKFIGLVDADMIQSLVQKLSQNDTTKNEGNPPEKK